MLRENILLSSTGLSLRHTSYPDVCLEKSFYSLRSCLASVGSAGGAGGDGDSCGVIGGVPITCITVAPIHGGGGVGSGVGTGSRLSSPLFLPRALPTISCEGGSIFVDGQKIAAFNILRGVLDEFGRDAAQQKCTPLVKLVLSSDQATKNHVIDPVMSVLSLGNPAASANKDGEMILAPLIHANPAIYVAFLKMVWVYAAPHLKDDPNVQRHSTE